MFCASSTGSDAESDDWSIESKFISFKLFSSITLPSEAESVSPFVSVCVISSFALTNEVENIIKNSIKMKSKLRVFFI